MEIWNVLNLTILEILQQIIYNETKIFQKFAFSFLVFLHPKMFSHDLLSTKI